MVLLSWLDVFWFVVFVPAPFTPAPVLLDFLKASSAALCFLFFSLALASACAAVGSIGDVCAAYWPSGCAFCNLGSGVSTGIGSKATGSISTTSKKDFSASTYEISLLLSAGGVIFNLYLRPSTVDSLRDLATLS